jgi:hypothetical protein
MNQEPTARRRRRSRRRSRRRRNVPIPQLVGELRELVITYVKQGDAAS